MGTFLIGPLEIVSLRFSMTSLVTGSNYTGF